ncbi:hypothetical protein [Escherichia phage M01]|nr:hypothetical protein [Escherichia phage M01]
MLIIGDLKTGRHRVEAKENKQLMLYALGVYRRLKRRYNITVVRLVIFQPYAGGASEWDISVEGLELFAKFAQKRALLALRCVFPRQEEPESVGLQAVCRRLSVVSVLRTVRSAYKDG